MKETCYLWIRRGALSFVLFALPQMVWAAPSVSLSANPTTLSVNGTTTLTWTISGATSCTATDSTGFVGPWQTTSGSGPITQAHSVQYGLECFDAGGNSSGKKEVIVVVTPTLSLSADKTSIKAGDPLMLTWTTQAANICFPTFTDAQTGGQTALSIQAENGNWTVFPMTSGSYSMTCSYYIQGTPRGTSPKQSVNVSVTQPAPCLFSGNLTWMTNCGASLSESLASGQTKTVTNTKPGYTGSTTYGCSDGVFTGPTGTTCSVSAGPANGPSITRFDGNVSMLTAPGNVTLTWNTANTSSCTASNGWSGPVTPLPNGSTTKSISVTTTFVLTCSSVGYQDVTREFQVTVQGGGGGGNSPIDGKCAPTHNNCLAGTSSTPQEDGANWYWNCEGLNGGKRVVCNEGKPSGGPGPGPSPSPGPGPNPTPGPNPAPGPGPAPLAPPNPLAPPAPTGDSPSLIPCGRNIDDKNTTDIIESQPCTLCHIVLGGQKLISWGLKIMAIIAITVIFAMGVLYILSAGNSGMMQTAKGGMIAALIGFAVMLSAYLIVNVILTILVDTASPDKPFLNLTATKGYFNFACDITSNVNGK